MYNLITNVLFIFPITALCMVLSKQHLRTEYFYQI